MPSIISSELRIKGDLVCQGDVLIEGVVEGDIECKSVTVGETAAITGRIDCETARICGMVKGTVSGHAVTLAPTARVIGDIVHDSIAIETGAYFEGQLRHRDTAPPSGARPGETVPARIIGTTPIPVLPDGEVRPAAVGVATKEVRETPRAERLGGDAREHREGRSTVGRGKAPLTH